MSEAVAFCKYLFAGSRRGTDLISAIYVTSLFQLTGAAQEVETRFIPKCKFGTKKVGEKRAQTCTAFIAPYK